MSWQPQANRENVLYQGGPLGVTYDFINHQPNGVEKSTSGSGTVNFGSMGAELTAGGADGVAILSAFNNFDIRFNSNLRIDMIWGADTLPTSGAASIGGVQTADGDFGSNLDIANAEYVADGDRFPTTVGEPQFTRFSVYVDEGNNETTFYQGTPVNETKQVNGAYDRFIRFAEVRGNTATIYIPFLRMVMW